MLGLSHGNYMMIGSKGPSDALARSLETLIDPQNTNGVVILHSKMTRAVSVLAAHCTRSVRAANHQLGAKYLLTPASLKSDRKGTAGRPERVALFIQFVLNREEPQYVSYPRCG